MLELRPATARGTANFGWLQSRHSFSFGHYYDPDQVGFSDLLVINDDRVSPGRGFGTHPHRDMEIFSYVLDGALEHKDSMGTGSVIRPGDVQMMSAGTGVRHSEFNHAEGQTTHFLQIWLLPDRLGHTPGYEQKAFSDEDKRGRLRLVASPDGREGSVTLHANASLRAGLFDGDESAELTLDPARKAWVHLARGTLTVNGHALQAGDALALSGETRLEISGGEGAEVLVFDLEA